MDFMENWDVEGYERFSCLFQVVFLCRVKDMDFFDFYLFKWYDVVCFVEFDEEEIVFYNFVKKFLVIIFKVIGIGRGIL